MNQRDERMGESHESPDDLNFENISERGITLRSQLLVAKEMRETGTRKRKIKLLAQTFQK
jgi:hypothetical protein